MKFGAVPIEQALGHILAHSTVAGAPYNTHRFAKGTKLLPDHIRELKAEDVASVIVAQLDAGDVEENEAALRLAQAIVPEPEAQGIRISGAGTGRVNLYALHSGVVRIDCDAVNALNAVDPMITLATVPPFHRADADGMIATIKIIAYAVGDAALAQAEKMGAWALSVAAPIYASATLIETKVTRSDPPLKGREALTGRLHRLGPMLSGRVVVTHDAPALAQVIKAAVGEVIFILTGSATSDPNDVGPAALRLAGGTVTHFGMPVDPGNLLFFGNLGNKPVIGLPGCARSPALNGADWVLERLICGIDVTSADIAAMGVGGLLKEIPTRPQPRSVPD